jgi:hypothetical protein
LLFLKKVASGLGKKLHITFSWDIPSILISNRDIKNVRESGEKRTGPVNQI